MIVEFFLFVVTKKNEKKISNEIKRGKEGEREKEKKSKKNNAQSENPEN